MPVRLKNPEQIEIMREGGRRNAAILKELTKAAKPGVSTKELDDLAVHLIAEEGDASAVLGYKPYGAKRPYPASICVSINDAVVHGIPNEHPYTIQEGDVVTLDLTMTHRGMITDMATTFIAGSGFRKGDTEAKNLIKATKKALELGIAQAKPGNTVGHIGAVIEAYIKPLGYGIVEELAGHGVGFAVHEDPYVPSYGNPGEGEPLVPGMTIAIEPIVNEGSREIRLDPDGYTYRTKDGSRSAHFEATVVITEKGCEILTK